MLLIIVYQPRGPGQRLGNGGTASHFSEPHSELEAALRVGVR